MTSPRADRVVATLFFIVTFFSVGEAAFESHVNYPAWLYLTDQSFRPYHQAISARIGVLIVPLVLSTILNVLLFWWRPRSIPLWTVWSTLGLQIGVWISAILVQIPIQVQLSAGGYSAELLQRLISTDLLYRKGPGYLRLAITGLMLYGVIKAAPVPMESEPPNNEMQRTKPAQATELRR